MTAESPEKPEDGERIAKFLARAGVASRRDAEKLVEQGIVTVDGKVLETPAFKVLPGMDVRVDGMRVGEKAPPRLWRYHKPAGLMTTHKDPQGRPTETTRGRRPATDSKSVGRPCGSLWVVISPAGLW